MCNALAHVEKSRLVLVQSNTWLCWLFLRFVTSTYQEHLLPEVINRKDLRLVSYGILRFALSHAFVERPSQGTSSLALDSLYI